MYNTFIYVNVLHILSVQYVIVVGTGHLQKISLQKISRFLQILKSGRIDIRHGFDCQFFFETVSILIYK